MKTYKQVFIGIILAISSYLLIVNMESIIAENRTYTVYYDDENSTTGNEIKESVAILRENIIKLNSTLSIKGLDDKQLNNFKQDMNISATMIFKNDFVSKKGSQNLAKHEVLDFFERNELDFSINRIVNKYELNNKSENYVSKKAAVSVLYSSIISVGDYAYYNYRTSVDFMNHDGTNNALFAINVQRAKSNLVLRINLLSMIIENYMMDGGNINENTND